MCENALEKGEIDGVRAKKKTVHHSCSNYLFYLSIKSVGGC